MYALHSPLSKESLTNTHINAIAACSAAHAKRRHTGLKVIEKLIDCRKGRCLFIAIEIIGYIQPIVAEIIKKHIKKIQLFNYKNVPI